MGAPDRDGTANATTGQTPHSRGKRLALSFQGLGYRPGDAGSTDMRGSWCGAHKRVDTARGGQHFESDMISTAHIFVTSQRTLTGTATAAYYYPTGRTGPI
jgi:hypothetical protein